MENQKKTGALVSATTSKPMPKWMSLMAIILGLAMLYNAWKIYAAAGLGGRVAYNLFIGIVCLYGSGISRRLYLSEIGVVREMHSWGRVVRRVLLWGDVTHVSFAFRGKQMMAFFESGDTGWKVPFLREQEEDVRDVLDDNAPDVEIEVLSR